MDCTRSEIFGGYPQGMLTANMFSSIKPCSYVIVTCMLSYEIIGWWVGVGRVDAHICHKACKAYSMRITILSAHNMRESLMVHALLNFCLDLVKD